MHDTDGWVAPTGAERAAILRRTRSVAVLGVSPNPARPSHLVAAYLLAHTDFDVHLVNPNATGILGRPVLGSLAELPVVPDLVDVFRRAADLPRVLAETLEVGAATLWLQSGLHDAALAREAQEAGLAVVMDRCLKVEHARLRAARPVQRASTTSQPPWCSATS